MSDIRVVKLAQTGEELIGVVEREGEGTVYMRNLYEIHFVMNQGNLGAQLIPYFLSKASNVISINTSLLVGGMTFEPNEALRNQYAEATGEGIQVVSASQLLKG